MLKRGKLIVGLLICSIISSITPVYAEASVCGTEYFDYVARSFSAGANHAICETVVLNDLFTGSDSVAVSEADKPVSTDAEVLEEENSCANIAVAQVDEYVNVRAKASKDSKVLGKLYNNCIATVLEKVDGWYKIESGSVTGYVAAEYVVVGDKEVYENAAQRIGTVKADRLNLRKKATTNSGVYTSIAKGKKVTVVDESKEDWLKVEYNSYKGYVAAEYVKVKTVYSYAESREEEAARLKAEEEARKEAEAEAKRQAEARKKQEAAAKKKYKAPEGCDGQAVADYAVQFVGNPYVLGGSSLTNGIDCSNFIMRIYEAFGVSLPHNSYALRSVGYEVSASEIQPGDIVCYSGHVSIYIGDGKVVHASNEQGGIKISPKWNYTYVITIRRIF